MDTKEIMSPLKPNDLEQILQSISSRDLVTITYITGDIFLGEIRKKTESHLLIAFNMPEGKRYGASQILKIPLDKIASLGTIPLSGDSVPKLREDDPEILWLKEISPNTHVSLELPVHNYPNPLATIIYDHNISLAHKYMMSTSLHLIEESLSQDGIPTTGIKFDKEFLMYIDWDFFLTQIKEGATTLAASPIPGLVTITTSVSQTREEQVIQRLKETLSDKVRQITSGNIGTYGVLKGALLVPEPPQDVTIEGKLCHLYRIANNDEDMPFLIKVDEPKIPLEFINRISSLMTAYGEILQIPVNILGQNYREIMLLRAMAFLK